MPAARYRIEDEPSPGALANAAVNPLWPLLGLMLGGFVVGVTWFIVNGIAVGSPTRVREIVVAAIGLAGATALAIGITVADSMGYLPGAASQYAILPLLLWKLGIGYLLYDTQGRTIEIFQHFGGVLRNGLPVVILASLARAPLMGAFPYLVWKLVAG